MKKILLLGIMMVLCNVMSGATVYTFVTSGGTFKLHKELNTLSFRGTTYNIIEDKCNSEANYIICESKGIVKLIVLDFTNDNIIEYDYIETFEWKDVALYNKANLVAGLYRNIDTYIYTLIPQHYYKYNFLST